ncbi:aminoglycoside 6-adenylyltransferase [Trichocoleus sp. FACHB-591]|uniref:aminoglycoside 6-adenylyltransferase n=1 Tax=Trichocoleus TaxID=450526 RepID=UPI001686EDE2|nr:aminoglycoside 6-adenylyltransferase [Trichocoleus sp. FACHB-591]MBD2094228.1 aminoglycoside 6-adenylyltransferase [Trichocoleus sp. FACHB-591]
MKVPTTALTTHQLFISRALPHLAADPRLVGVAATGSWAENSMDEFSDLDLIIAVEHESFAQVMSERESIAASLGELLAAFTGEHVGEPRVLICLYNSPLLHVDLKFLSITDVATRVDEPVVLWERDDRLSQSYAASTGVYPLPSEQWIEDRFWIWIQYGTSKIARGELFEALDFISYLRSTVLGPLGLLRSGCKPSGVRKIEQLAPTLAETLESTVALHDRESCYLALERCLEIYRALRSTAITHHAAAEEAAVEYLKTMRARQG